MNEEYPKKKKEEKVMKIMKKLATLMLAVCLMVPCFSMLTYAADGQIQFTDPETAVGETLEVKGVVKKTSGTWGKIEISMTYDTSMLKFKSGDGVTESQAGTLVYSGDATNNTGNRIEFIMKFDVLKAGTTRLSIKGSSVKSTSGAILDYEEGYSIITIAAGNGTTSTTPSTSTPSTSTEGTVEVNGVSYVISNEFPERDIPEGYEKATLDYDLATYNVVLGETSGLYLAYLVNEENVGDFFMYVEENATFAPFEEITISDTTKIALLSDVSEIVLPKEYAQTTVILNGTEFPAWHNTGNTDYCIFYAINSNGEKALYQLDRSEGTYQRFIAPDVVNEEDNNTLIGKLESLLENHLDYVILGTGLGFLLFVVIIVVLSVKLYNRNAELDELYDEYGIDEEEKTEDDVVLDLDDEDYDDEDDSDVEVELYVQESIKGVFTDEVVDDAPSEVTVEDNEETLGNVLKKQVDATEEEKDEFFDDDDGILENFSMDFIDLDD